MQVDVLVPSQPHRTTTSPIPLLIWYHGGGLVQGNRKAIAAHHIRAVDEVGIAIASPDYRLTPQIRVPELQQDIVAFTQYVHDSLQKDLLGAAGDETQLDLTRIAVSGSSAGGWIAFWLGLGMLQGVPPSIQSSIRAIAPIYPITTMDHPFFQNRQTPFMGRLEVPETNFAIFKDPNAPVVSNTADTPMRNKLYMHAQQEALFPTLLFSDEQRNNGGWLQSTDVMDYVRRSSPHSRAAWAPVYMIHGALDTAVDIDQARLAQKALDAVGHPVTLEERSDKDHLWDLLEPEEQFQGYWHFLSKQLGL